MFSKKQRLNSHSVTYIMKKGKRVFNTYLKSSYIKTEDFRVSIVISKKVLKRRVDRNSEKRRIIHIIKNIYKNNALNINIIISLQKNTQLLSNIELEEYIKSLFNKIN